MPDIALRKFHVILDETLHDGGPVAETPLLRGAIVAVIKNPYAGRYEEDIMPFVEALKPLGLEMSKRLVGHLGGEPAAIHSYGKGAIVGEDGELEHGAVWHVPGGYAMREVLGGAKAIVPSTKKVAGIGATLDVPLCYKDSSKVRSHYDAFTVSVPDAPKRDEIAFILTMTTGGRLHQRVGTRKIEELTDADA